MPVKTIDRSLDGKPSFPFALRQPLLLAGLYTLCLLFLASALFSQFGFPLDDSYIHQTVARNLARYGIPGFIPGVRSSGTTSLLWTCIQAANYKFVHINPVVYNLLISCALLCCIGPLVFANARRDGLSARCCWILAATPAMCGNFIWLGLIGMEHLLFVALSLAAIYFWFDISQGPAPAKRNTALLTGIVVGLLAVTRPEAAVFGPLLLIGSAVLARLPTHQVAGLRRRPSADSAIVLGLWAVSVGIMLAANLYTSRALMPATLKGRTWLYFHTSGGPHTVATVTRYLGAWVQRLPRQFSTVWVHQMRSLGQVRGTFAVLGFALAALAILGALLLVAAKPLRTNCLFAWAFVHFCIYMATFPTGGHAGRYQPLTLLLLFPCLGFAVLWMATQVAALFMPKPSRFAPPRVVTGVVFAVALAAGAASLLTWRTVTVDGIEHIDNTHGRIAEWLEEHAPPNARIAAFDIGRISYDWGRGITDLGGLVDPRYYPYLVHGRVPEYLKQKRIQYLVLPSEGTEGFGFPDPSLGMVKVAQYCTPNPIWEIGFRYTIHATQCQELYKLDAPGTPPNPLSASTGHGAEKFLPMESHSDAIPGRP